MTLENKSTLSSTSPPSIMKDDVVNSPKHYRMQGVEAIDIMEMSMTEEEFQGYLKGNILKYLIRYKHKSKPKEDLQKAQWYIEKLINKI